MDYLFHQDGVKVRVLDGPYLLDGRPTERAVSDAAALMARLEEFKGFAADQLGQLYHDAWLDEEIGEVDRAGFAARLQRPSLHLYDELGVAVVYFDDGDLFGGHGVKVRVEQGVPTQAGIVG